MMLRMIGFSIALIASGSNVGAQQFQWSEIQNLPIGQNMPAGVNADILGLRAGTAFPEAKAILEKLLAEGPPPSDTRKETTTMESERRRILQDSANRMMGANPRPPLEEVQMEFSLPVSPPVTARYVGKITIRREMPGSTGRTLREYVSAYFSSPASGHQVVAVTRNNQYPERSDQPRIGELIAALREKFKAEPRIERSAQVTTLYLVFSKGGVADPKIPYGNLCVGPMNYETINDDEVPKINPKRTCDVSLTVTMPHGTSNDHASAVSFTLVDAQRMKENYTADFDFFDRYVKKAMESKGKPPKL